MKTEALFEREATEREIWEHAALGQDVEVVIKPTRRRHGEMSVVVAA